jgi:SAM-dependent methyltransferase
MTENSNWNDQTLSYYEDNAKKFFDGTVNINMTVLYRPFIEYMPPYASILDAGCGSGRDTLYLAKRGYRVTAFDNSPAIVKMASKLSGQEVLQLSFQDLQFENKFHGVWACSSLLHIPLNEMNDVLFRLSRAMKVDGVLYTSFKYGMGEHDRNGRLFVDLDEKGFDELIKVHPELTVIRYWQTGDLRPGRGNEKWLNLLLRKTKPTKRMTFLGVGQAQSTQ